MVCNHAGRRLVRGALLMAGCSGCFDYSVSTQAEEAHDPVTVVETFTQEAAAQVDVLWVVDNTGSMTEEQEALASSFEAFVDGLDEACIAYHLGVVPADVARDDSGELVGNPWIITPSAEDPVQAFMDAVDLGVEGTGPEAGLGAAYLALTDPLRSGANRGFRRATAALHVIVVSDADDESDTVLGDEPVDLFLEFLEDEADSTGTEVMFSAVAGDVPSGCHGSGGTARPGYRYLQVVEERGGTFASICTADLSGVLESLGEESRVYTTRFELQAVPEPDSLLVQVDGIRQVDNWLLETDPPAVTFNTAPEPDSEIQVRYQVYEEGE